MQNEGTWAWITQNSTWVPTFNVSSYRGVLLCRPSNQEPKNPKTSDYGPLCKQLVSNTESQETLSWKGSSKHLLNISESLGEPKGSWAGASLHTWFQSIGSLTAFKARLLTIYVINRDSNFLKIHTSFHNLIQISLRNSQCSVLPLSKEGFTLNSCKIWL